MTALTKPQRYVYLAFSIAVVVIFLFPIFWMVSTSLKTNQEIFSLTPTLFPRNPTLDGYIAQLQARETLPITVFFRNSVIISVNSMVLTILLSASSAYGLARFRLRIGGLVLFIFLVAQMLPPVMFLIPLFQTFTAVGLLDTYTSVVINTALFTVPLGVLVLRPYFMTVPKDLEDSAIIDGCSRITAFTRVIAPLAAPGILVVSALSFLFAWGNLIGPLTFIRSQEMLPLTVNMYRAIGQYGSQWGQIMAYATIVTIPVFIIFLSLQKKLVTGLTAGAVKG